MLTIKIYCPAHLGLEMPRLSVACRKNMAQEVCMLKWLGIDSESDCNIMYFKTDSKTNTILAEITIIKKRDQTKVMLDALSSIVTRNILGSIVNAKIGRDVSIHAQVTAFDVKKSGYSTTTYRPRKK